MFCLLISFAIIYVNSKFDNVLGKVLNARDIKPEAKRSMSRRSFRN